MNRFIPALLFLANASTAFAENQSDERSETNQASQQLIISALENAQSQPYSSTSMPVAHTPGIGPSSRTAQPGEYGYSAWNDLRQLNF